MKIEELLKTVKVKDSHMQEILKQHPKQFVSNTIDIPVWSVKYEYDTVRGNHKSGEKYLFLPESAWDQVESEFAWHIETINDEHPDRKLSNVEILDVSYLGELVLEIN